ncbi:PDZ domain (Also known as DHR or GLGF) [Nesidiocoris tenuis]|uniref:PDZ domain (Also known as DHR or GLGF) n=1 Tax=Nesidiocoris tenuis TaxID=355587 RepID=A0ABN7ADX2_9HEMI|nr:PDZ domain (Also known as DHR or GLGF) [Nesidiocoris tenuis]
MTTTGTTDSDVPPNGEWLRLCHIIKWESFDGYGFNLRAEKGKPGQFVGKVDEGSPAESAGLLEGDRIVEVNDVNIANENHKQVVTRIKSVPNETRLLVVHPDGDAYFKARNIPIDGTLDCVKAIKTAPDPNPTKPFVKTPNSPESGGTGTPTSDDNVSQNSVKSQQSSETESSPRASIITNNGDQKEKSSLESMMNEKNATLKLNMTAKELRAQLAAKKKYDPKKDSSINFKKKYEIVQKL